MTQRVRFEVRVLGVATVEKFHVIEEVTEIPKVGELAGPSIGAPRGVKAIEKAPAPWNLAAVVKLEDFDHTFSGRDFEAEVKALRKVGWKQ
jgi:hypothetical protein